MDENQLDEYLSKNLSIKIEWDRGRLCGKLLLKDKVIDADYIYGNHLASYLAPMIQTRNKPIWR